MNTLPTFRGLRGRDRGNISVSWRWVSIVSMIAIISAIGLAFRGFAGAALAQSGQSTIATARTVAVWMQVMDSCKQALPGATFRVSGPGVNMTTAPTTGAHGPQMAKSGSNGNCPIQHGTCNFPTGCTVADVNVPSSGTVIYKIIPAKTAPGSPGSKNLSYAVCNGGSDCAHGPEVATVNVSSSGSVSATVLNPYPDGTTVTWPTDKQAYRGTQSDPILFHEFGIGDGSIQCDGDHDADDYLTGTPGAHCSSNLDGGRSRTGTKTSTKTKTSAKTKTKAPIH